MAEKNNKEPKEIDVMEILLKVWKARRTIYISVFIFILLGILFVFFSPKEYKSQSTLLIETSSSGGGLSSLLQQFGGLTGMGLDKKTKEALIPELYPEVIFTSTFLIELLDEKIVESEYDSAITVSDYFKLHTKANYFTSYTIGLPGKIMSIFKGSGSGNSVLKDSAIDQDSSVSDFLDIGKSQLEIIKNLKGRISTEQDFNKNNKISVTVKMQDPYVAAQINLLIVKKLGEYVIEYRTKKAETDLDFVSDQYEEVKKEYIAAQQALANYRDRNKNVILASVKTEEERLEAEYNLAFEVYNTVAQQLENAKIKVQENTPVLIMMDPPNIPLEKDSPKTMSTIVIMAFVGFVVGIGIILIRLALKRFLKDFKSIQQC